MPTHCVLRLESTDARARHRPRPSTSPEDTNTWRQVAVELLAAALAHARDVTLHLFFQQREWHRAGVEHHAMEVPLREALAELLLRALAQLEDAQLADHIGTG